MNAQNGQVTVTVDLETAYLIAKVFCPKNPNKLRNAAPEVIAAAHAFKDATRKELRDSGDLRSVII